MEPLSARATRPLLRIQSDERLATLAAMGHERAFEAIVCRYRGPLLRACRRVLPEAVAEDAVQEALLRAHRALRRHGAPQSLRPWIHRIAINAALSEAGRRPTTAPIAEGDVAGEAADEAHERREELRAVLLAVDALPVRQRRALVLRELEGRSHEEIARELGLSGGAVRQLIHRARNGVRAAATAITPSPLLAAALAQGGGGVPPAAEVVGAGAGGGLAAKAAVAAIVVGGAGAGSFVAPLDLGPDRNGARGASVARPESAPGQSDGAVVGLRSPDQEDAGGEEDGSSGPGPSGGDQDEGDREHEGEGHGDGEGQDGDGRRGDGDDDGARDDAREGESGDEDDLTASSGGPGSSGSGSGASDSRDGSSNEPDSGSGSSGSGSSGSGSGSGSSGSGGSGSGG